MTRADVRAVISEMNRNDMRCQGAPQQVANGFFRLYDILELIAFELDKNGVYSSAIRSVRNTLNSNERYSNSAPQQAANGVYRVVELLNQIVSILDDSGTYRRKAASVLVTMSSNERLCQSSPQQMANGAYRLAEMAQIVADIVAPESASQVSRLILDMNLTNSRCQGAPQQTANGTSTVSDIAAVIVRAVDKGSRYSGDLSQINIRKITNNSRCQGADQQSGNYLYRTVEMLNLVCNVMLDAAEERTARYWEAHQDERRALLNEKKDCQNKIREIELQALNINANDELMPIQRENSKLLSEMNAYGRDQLSELEREVVICRCDIGNIAFFKFGERKAAEARLAAANAAVDKFKREIDRVKSGYNAQIEMNKSRIKSINDKVDAQRSRVLSGCDPYKRRIEEIDRELTRSR